MLVLSFSTSLVNKKNSISKDQIKIFYNRS